MSVEHRENPEVRLPRVARLAGRVIEEIDSATEESPLSLDGILGERSIIDVLRTQLKTTEGLYDRYNKLLFPNGIPPEWSMLPNLDFSAILDLLEETNKMLREQEYITRGIDLGYIVLQLAEAGAQMACNPSPITIPPPEGHTLEEEVIDECTNFAQESFGKFSSRIRGNRQKIPKDTMTYPGNLLQILHYLVLARSSMDAMSPELRQRAYKMLVRLPQKIESDMHSSYGRPDQGVARDGYAQMIRDFHESLEKNESPTTTIWVNVRDIVPFILEAIKKAFAAGHTSKECLQIVIQNSTAIGRLTERTLRGLPSKGNRMVNIDSSSDDPRVDIGFPEDPYSPDYPPEIVGRLRQRDNQGGICPARNVVPVNTTGGTYNNAVLLSEAIKDRIGIKPPFLLDARNGEAYINPPALLASYVVLAIAEA
jgi:hypothetical protein